MEKQRVALFGGTGKLGRHIVEHAISRGYHLKVLVDNPDKLKTNGHQDIEVVKGDVLNYEDVLKAVEGTDAVISVIGHSLKNLKDSPEMLQRDATKNIVRAMEESKVDKVITLSGRALPFRIKDEPKLYPDKFSRFKMKVFVPKVIEDAEAHHRVLRKSKATWIIVRGAKFTDDPLKRRYRIGWVGKNSGRKIGRQDLAHFIVKQIPKDSFNYQMPFVSY